jgi:hypothetical protein
MIFTIIQQQQLALGQQQTLLFMTNSSNFTRRVRRPFVSIASVKAKNGIDGRAKMVIKAMKHAKLKLRRQRDLDSVDALDGEQHHDIDTDEVI